MVTLADLIIALALSAAFGMFVAGTLVSVLAAVGTCVAVVLFWRWLRY